jgi:selenocysteine-specific translation elongation factor
MKTLPYVYILTHKTSGHFYVGYREQNIKFNRSSSEDLGIKYFSSCPKIKKANFNEYDALIVYEGFDSEAAFNHEQSLIKENWGNPLLLNEMMVSNHKPLFKRMTGRKHTEETKWLLSMRLKGEHEAIAEYKKKKRAEHYQRRSVAMKQNNPGFKEGNATWNKNMKGWRSAEELQAMTEKRLNTRATRTYRCSEHQKQTLRDLRTGKPAWNRGKSHSEETKRKISEAKKKRLR